MMVNLCNLPNEIINVIFDYLDDEDSQALAITCIKMFRIWKKSYSINSLLRKYMFDEISESGISASRRLFSEYCYYRGRSYGNDISKDEIDIICNKIYNLYNTTKWLTPYKLIKLYYANQKIKEYKKKLMIEIREYNKAKNIMCDCYDYLCSIDYLNKDTELNRNDQLMINHFQPNPGMIRLNYSRLPLSQLNEGIEYKYEINGNYYKNKLRTELKKYKTNNKIINPEDINQEYEDKLLLNKLIDEHDQPNEFENYKLLLDDTYTEIFHL